MTELGEPVSAKVRLRRATIDDRASMLRVMSPFKNAHFPGGLRSEWVRIAELDDDMVGFVGWKENQILALYVAEQWRGRRCVGDRLLDAAETAIRKAGHDGVRIMIDADATNAHRFYQKHGYSTDWDRENEDIAWMTKALLNSQMQQPESP